MAKSIFLTLKGPYILYYWEFQVTLKHMAATLQWIIDMKPVYSWRDNYFKPLETNSVITLKYS